MMRPNHPFLSKGPSHPAAKLNAECRADIHRRYRDGETPKAIAGQYAVCKATIYRILREES